MKKYNIQDAIEALEWACDQIRFNARPGARVFRGDEQQSTFDTYKACHDAIRSLRALQERQTVDIKSRTIDGVSVSVRYNEADLRKAIAKQREEFITPDTIARDVPEGFEDGSYVARCFEGAGYDVFRVREGLREAGLPFSIFDAFYRKAALADEE